MPKVWVIIPTYNRATLLRRAIASVTSQSYDHWHAIIVDDGSTDSTVDVLAELIKQTPKRLSVIQQENGGVGAARNTGIDKALALGAKDDDIILFLDSDDELVAGAFEKAIALLQEFKDCRCIFVGAQTPDGKKAFRMDEPRFTSTFTEFLQQKAWGEMLVFAQASLFSNTAYRFDTEVNGGEVLLWWKISEHEPIGFADEILRIYHSDATNSLTRAQLTPKSAHNLYLLNKKLSEEFGDLLRKHNPHLLAETLSMRARMAALIGMKKEAKNAWHQSCSLESPSLKQRLLYWIAQHDHTMVITNLLIRLFV